MICGFDDCLVRQGPTRIAADGQPSHCGAASEGRNFPGVLRFHDRPVAIFITVFPGPRLALIQSATVTVIVPDDTGEVDLRSLFKNLKRFGPRTISA